MKLYKYRGGDRAILRRDLRSLAKNEIFAASLNSLNDPHEALIEYNENTLKLWEVLKDIPNTVFSTEGAEADQRLTEAFVNLVKRSRECGIYSLSRSSTDELLWAYYGDSHRGFCIEYDLDMLTAYKMDQDTVLEVDYKHEAPVVKAEDIGRLLKSKESMLQALLGTKSIRWRHESEIRIVTNAVGFVEYDFRAVTGVYFGHRCDSKFKKLVMRVLAGRGISYFDISLKDKKYELQSREIDDEYYRSIDYRKRVALLDFDLSAKYIVDDPNYELLKRIVETVRRDPYCEKVIGAHTSSTKGTKNEPCICVMYERSDSSVKNIFLTERDIKA